MIPGKRIFTDIEAVEKLMKDLETIKDKYEILKENEAES